jgi:tRNA pseudouridine55 synthase
MSSAQVIRDCQHHFNPSEVFAPLLEQERKSRERESKGEQRRRKQIKRDLQVKMGHGGTLDPLATGVLILGVGKGTKALPNFLHCTKTYETVVLFGASTDTYDRVGRIVKKGQYDEITRPTFEKALEGFRGKYKQMPPLFAALKMDGKPIYEYAREGKPLPREIPVRDVEVLELEMLEWYEPGTHNHRWPTEEAQEVEKNLVNSVWQKAKRQTDGEFQKLSPEQEEQEVQALAKLEATKKNAETKFDDLISEKSKPKKSNRPDPVMSGALGDLPKPVPKGRGSDLIPPPPDPSTPPPWKGKGPPAAKLRMTVTSGFYVRSLCHDLGEKLGSGGLMAELVRTRQGDFTVGSENCIEYDDLAKGEKVWGPQVDRALTHWMRKPDGTNANQDAPKAQAQKRSFDQSGDAGEKQASPKRARKNSSSPEPAIFKKILGSPKKESSPRKESSPKKARKSKSPEAASPKKQQAAQTPIKDVPQVDGADDVKQSVEDEWNGFEDTPQKKAEA